MVFDLLTYSNEFLWPYISMEKILGFNPILQKFCEMISEITSSKTVWRIFLIFCRSRFINNFVVKNSFSENWSHQELNISRPIYFLKKFAYHFQDLTVTNKLEGFFFKRLWHNCFPVDFVKFLKTPFLQNTSERLLLNWVAKICSQSGHKDITCVDNITEN